MDERFLTEPVRLYFTLDGRNEREMSPKGETFATRESESKGAAAASETERKIADVAARLKVNFENGFDGPRRKSFPAARFRNPRTLICRRR